MTTRSAAIAQLGERSTEDADVRRSIRLGGTSFFLPPLFEVFIYQVGCGHVAFPHVGILNLRRMDAVALI